VVGRQQRYTTVKEMVASILRPRAVLATQGNYKTSSASPEPVRAGERRFAVLEMGASKVATSPVSPASPGRMRRW
jgi:UDP-N-acetylmuramyl pentapeptide synthase